MIKLLQKKMKIIYNYYRIIFFFLFIIFHSFLFTYLSKQLQSQKSQILNLKYNQNILLKLWENYLNDNKTDDKHLFANNEFENENKKNIELFDKDMIGLKYPQILYNELKFDFKFKNLSNSLIDFLNQLEIKLLFLMKTNSLNFWGKLPFFILLIFY